MTDITADEYRTAAKVCEMHEYDLAVVEFRTAADRLETSHVDLAIQITEVVARAVDGRDLEGLISPRVKEIRDATVVTLAYLDDHGRLGPEGGRVLTAEQVEDVRTVLNEAGKQLSGFDVYPEWDRLRALFPATEPAEEEREIGWFRTMTPKFATTHFGFPGVAGSHNFWTHTASDGGKWAWDGGEWELREYPPAPAVPAEEETKAEEVRTHTPAHHNPETGTTRITVQRSCNRCGRNLGDATEKELDACVSGAPLPDVHEECGCVSSLVVPAPTETEWATLVEVPENVEFRGTFGGGSLTETVWVKRDGTLWHSRPGKTVKECQRIASLAPFVAAAGEGDA